MEPPRTTTPIESHHDIVRHEWGDPGGRMATGMYMVVFDLATGGFFIAAGWSRQDRVPYKASVFTLEAHFTCERSVHVGNRLRFTTQLLDFDGKRVHYLHRMHHADEGWLAATNELVSVNVNTETRRSAPFPDELQARFASIRAAHDALGRPAQAGRSVRLDAHA